MPTSHRIALLFNANKIFEREVIEGIAAYLASTRSSWDLFLEEDFRLRLPGTEDWQGDGVIADVDDPAVAAALARSRIPVVAVGGSYDNVDAYPSSRDCSFIAAIHSTGCRAGRGGRRRGTMGFAWRRTPIRTS